MKKRTIIALIVAAVLLVTGGIILILGLSYAADPNQDNITMLTQSEHTIPEVFDSILIDTEDCHVSFVPFKGEADPHVVIHERERTSHSVVVEDGTLKIRMMDTRRWQDFIGINWQSMDMTVYLPQKQYESVRITTATGTIQIPEGFHIQEMRLHSATGGIDCAANVTGELGCFTTTGSISVRNAAPTIMTLESDTGKIHASGINGTELHLDNSTGRTELENVSCILLTCESETGDVTVQNVMIEDILQIFTDTGDVLIESSDAGSVNIETDTGDVTGNFLTSKWFQAFSDAGDVDVPQTRDGGECRIQTDTGDIRFF